MNVTDKEQAELLAQVFSEPRYTVNATMLVHESYMEEKMIMENRCVCCGTELPEGYGQVCKKCATTAIAKSGIIESVKDRISFSYGDNPCIHIKDSHLIDDEDDMRTILEYIHGLSEYQKLKECGYTRTLEDELIEWKGHNALYELKYKQSQTGSVDIDQKEPWYRKIIYFILSIFKR